MRALCRQPTPLRLLTGPRRETATQRPSRGCGSHGQQHQQLRSMKVAVEGCCHGELDKIYAAMRHLEVKEGIKIDLLICCGDFQAVRNEDDLACMSVPDKYKSMGTFYKYYTGEAVAPYPTIFVGGNHEASNYLWELYYGGWVCPNIYFLGFSGVVRFGDLRIGGLSGIWKPGDYRRPYTAGPPYIRGQSDIRSAYHIREFDVFKLSQLSQHLDVFISHDWPQGVARFGDAEQLFRSKPFLKQEVLDGSLGSQPGAQLLGQLAPDYWFSAHLHVRFPALIPRSGHDSRGGHTRFLALDKCLPGRNFLQVVDMPGKSGGPLCFDEEWLAITRACHPSMPISHPTALPRMPPPGVRLADSHLGDVRAALARAGAAVIGDAAFMRTVEPHDPGRPRRGAVPSGTPRNPQTLALMELLQLDYCLDGAPRGGGGGQQHQQPLPPPPPLLHPHAAAPAVLNAEEVELPCEDDPVGQGTAVGGSSANPEEVALD